MAQVLHVEGFEAGGVTPRRKHVAPSIAAPGRHAGETIEDIWNII